MILPSLTSTRWSSAAHRPSTHHFDVIIIILYVTSFLPVNEGIRLEHVEVPNVVAVGESATLLCDVDLERDELYSVKWYKDNEEFYQWKPKGNPAVKTYPVEGIQVDRGGSVKETVVLRAVTPATAGFFRCEASGEGPAFRSVSGGATLSVVILPRRKPEIFGGFTGFDDETVELNCSSDGSRPAARLRWLINGVPVHPGLVQEASVSRTSSGLETSFSVLELNSKDHFPRAGAATVTCESAIPYHVTVERPFSTLDWSAGGAYAADQSLPPVPQQGYQQRRIASELPLNGGERIFRSRTVASHDTLQSLTLRKEIIIYVNGANWTAPSILLVFTLFTLFWSS